MHRKANVVIVDDEKKVRATIRELILDQCPQLCICGEADSAESAHQLILKTKPDLVFLDIEMPGGSGFDLLNLFDTIDFHTIFITAYDQYALMAIKFSALDYILKPVNSIELLRSVNKFWKRQNQGEGLKNLLENLVSQKPFTKIAIPSVSKIQYIEVGRILYCEADGAYTQIHLDDGSQLISTKILKDFEAMLDDNGFFRLHRSYLINLKHVVEYGKGKNDSITLTSGHVVQFSRKFRAAILEVLPQHQKLN